ncbi:MAG: histidine phosphatase family protein [Chloroflexia bacterium]
MLRARQTARVIATRHPGLRVRVARALIEVGTTWQGTPWTVIGADANLYEPLKAPGDETMDAIADRMEAFIHRLRRRHAGETVVCVSHADPVMIARVRLQGIALSMRAIRAADYPERGSVTRLRFGDDGSLEVSYSSPAQSLIKPAQVAKREAPAEASGE